MTRDRPESPFPGYTHRENYLPFSNERHKVRHFHSKTRIFGWDYLIIRTFSCVMLVNDMCVYYSSIPGSSRLHSGTNVEDISSQIVSENTDGRTSSKASDT